MATHCGRGRIDDCARSGEWECEKWGGNNGHDIRLVWVRAASRRDPWIAGDDIEYSIVGSVDR